MCVFHVLMKLQTCKLAKDVARTDCSSTGMSQQLVPVLLLPVSASDATGDPLHNTFRDIPESR